MAATEVSPRGVTSTELLAGGLLVFSLGVLLVLHAQGWRRRS